MSLGGHFHSRHQAVKMNALRGVDTVVAQLVEPVSPALFIADNMQQAVV